MSWSTPTASFSGPDSKEIFHAVVPALGQLGDGELSADQLLLQLEAEQDVQVVGHLVPPRPGPERPRT